MTTPFGPLQLAATDLGVVGVWFGSADDANTALKRDLGDATFTENGGTVVPARSQVEEYLRGERHAFDLPLDWRRSKGFRLRVLQELATVPFGLTVSYGELARRCGSPAATRAVGSA